MAAVEAKVVDGSSAPDVRARTRDFEGLRGTQKKGRRGAYDDATAHTICLECYRRLQRVLPRSCAVVLEQNFFTRVTDKKGGWKPFTESASFSTNLVTQWSVDGLGMHLRDRVWPGRGGPTNKILTRTLKVCLF